MEDESRKTTRSERPRARDRVKVFLVNRRDIVRRGLHAVIEDADDMVVAGETAAPRPDPETIAAVDPDVVIVDPASPAEAIASVEILHDDHGHTPTIVLDHADDDRGRQSALDAGADGFLPDDAKEGDVQDAVRGAARGEKVRGTAPRPPTASDPGGEPTPDLTYREGQVLRLIARGMTNRQIGDRLGLAEKTVKNYTSTLLAKLHLRRRTQAAIYQITHEDSPGSA